jgi:acetyl-CoA carboxylase carboxyl transferase subunit beta
LRAAGIGAASTTCPACELELTLHGLDRNLRVCYACGHHMRVGARQRLNQIADSGLWSEIFQDVEAPADPLRFVDSIPYSERLLQMRRRTALDEALIAGELQVGGHDVLGAAFDFDFLGGSMGVVVGERVALTLEAARQRGVPALFFCASGGARMQEGSLSLGQMAKTVVALEAAREDGVPIVAVLTDPCMGGVMASFASLADVILAEPGATIGFAGKRVIYQATYEDLPEDFQTSEYFHQRGYIDRVVPRAEMRDVLTQLLRVYAGRRRWGNVA